MLALVLPVAFLGSVLLLLARTVGRRGLSWRRAVVAGCAIATGIVAGALPGLVLFILAVPGVATGPPPGGSPWVWIGAVAALGAMGGAALAAFFMGKRLGRPGARALWTVVGGAIGAVLAWGIAARLPFDAPAIAWLLLLPAIPIAGLVGFVSAED